MSDTSCQSLQAMVLAAKAKYQPKQNVAKTFTEITDALYGLGIDSETRLEHLLKHTRTVSDRMFWRVFNFTWSSCDDTHHLQDDLLFEMFARGSGVKHLLAKGRTFYDALPEAITVYRGCSEDRIHNVSWTTSFDIAVGFAKGHRGIRVPKPVVVEATISKSDVFTVIVDREEFEIILNPDELGIVRVQDLIWTPR